jgi:hypothetical protein
MDLRPGDERVCKKRLTSVVSLPRDGALLTPARAWRLPAAADSVAMNTVV